MAIRPYPIRFADLDSLREFMFPLGQTGRGIVNDLEFLFGYPLPSLLARHRPAPAV